MSFLLNQIAQQTAEAPTKILYISFLLSPINHPLNIWRIFMGGVILKETCTILQIILANWQSKKRCWIVSSKLQKQHFILPFHCQRARLSLVRTTPFCKYHMKTLIFKGIFNFQMILLYGTAKCATKALYIDRTVNWLFCFNVHKKVSFWSVNWTFTTLATRWSQAC